MSKQPDIRPWWGDWVVAPGQHRRWQIGPLGLYVERLEDEWRIAIQRGEDPLSMDLEVAEPITEGDRPAPEKVERYAGVKADDLHLSPATADRTIVTRPQAPFHVGGQGEVLLYVSAPLWARVQIGAERILLTEFPLHRPSDTWLGPSTQVGEKAYATLTHCRTDLAQLPKRPHRAVTRVLVRNLVDETLHIDRLSVPVPYLSLFDGGGTLWTESISLTREDDQDGLANLKIDERPPPEAGRCERLDGPRQDAEQGRLVRAFGALL